MEQSESCSAAEAVVSVFDADGIELPSTTVERALKAERKGSGTVAYSEAGPTVLRLNYVPDPATFVAPPRTETVCSQRKRRLKSRLRSRDGTCCFYCLRELKLADATIEHLLARHLKASDSPANKVLAHQLCNELADNLPIAEKVRLRERNLIRRLASLDSDEARQQFLERIKI